jgi:hypothetical protein
MESKQLHTKIILDWWENLRDQRADQVRALGQPSQLPGVTQAADEELQLLSALREVLSITTRSKNPWNRPELQHLLKTKYKVLERGFLWVDELPPHDDTVFALDASRATIGIDYFITMSQVLRIFLSKMELRQTVVLDRSFRITDGLQTTRACLLTGYKIKFLRLDYENEMSGLI